MLRTAWHGANGGMHDGLVSCPTLANHCSSRGPSWHTQGSMVLPHPTTQAVHGATGRPRTAHARTTNQPTELHPSTCLEVAARYEQVYLLALCLLQVLQGAVDVIQLPMAAALYGDLFARDRMAA